MLFTCKYWVAKMRVSLALFLATATIMLVSGCDEAPSSPQSNTNVDKQPPPRLAAPTYREGGNSEGRSGSGGSGSGHGGGGGNSGGGNDGGGDDGGGADGGDDGGGGWNG